MFHASTLQFVRRKLAYNGIIESETIVRRNADRQEGAEMDKKELAMTIAKKFVGAQVEWEKALDEPSSEANSWKVGYWHGMMDAYEVTIYTMNYRIDTLIEKLK